MKIKDVFNNINIIVIGGHHPSYPTYEKGQIINVNLNGNSISLRIRNSDSVEGDSSLRIKEEFKNKENDIMKWFVDNQNTLIGLTLGQLRELEIDIKK